MAGVNSNISLARRAMVRSRIQRRVTNVEQFFFASGGSAQRLPINFDVGGTGFVLAGSSGNDTLNASGDGTSASDITFGSLSLDVDLEAQ